MEINRREIIPGLFLRIWRRVESDIVYWDDVMSVQDCLRKTVILRVNLEGISSRINGHRWGTYSNATVSRNNNQNYGSYSFGNEKAMDTWAYALNIAEIKTQDITVKVADLEVVSVETSSSQVELGENFTYIVTVRNNGPSAVDKAPFHFNLPQGVIIQQEEVVLSFTVRGRCCSGCEPMDMFAAKATIMRIPDMTDPDATSTDILKLLPNTAEEELCQ
ncbi:hypothetical protein FQR65_LT17592 [Abscondita terminalis]|nr:hypothetical protein FQR65_LT17592 [Abscondita terminalis]